MNAQSKRNSLVENSADILHFPAPQKTVDWKRMSGLAAGLGVQAFFLITVVSLYEFLRYGSDHPSPDWLWVDVLLACQFAVPHSLLLLPWTRRKLQPWIHSEFYGLFYCFFTCLSLQVLFCFWQSSGLSVWELKGSAQTVVLTGFYLSWAMLFYSLHLGGLGYQTGWTQWLHWWNRRKLPRREFAARSLYRWFRHPVYLSFLGLIWFTPVMTVEHAVLTGLWTVYIFLGSWLKDERLQFYLGDSYREYRTAVPGYPFMNHLPIVKRPAPDRMRSAA